MPIRVFVENQYKPQANCFTMGCNFQMAGLKPFPECCIFHNQDLKRFYAEKKKRKK